MNKIILAGKVYTEPEFSHECRGRELYKFYLESIRTSGTPDILPVMVEKSLIGEVKKDDYVKIVGEIRTRNTQNEEGVKLEIKVHVKEFVPYEDKDENDVSMEAYVCKNSFVRRTPRGRKIADVILASHRKPNCKSSITDYIPCVFWGRIADEIEEYPLGTLVLCKGRLQSREYKKRMLDGSVENRVAYEFSVANLDE